MLGHRIESLNRIRNLHWQARRRLKKRWAWHFWNAANAAGISMRYSKPETERMILRIRSFRKRLLDYDNLVGGSKTLIDVIKEARFIVDDSSKWIDLQISQERSKEERTEIEIERKEN